MRVWGTAAPRVGGLPVCTAEGVEVGVEHKIVPLTQRNAQATQGSFDPGPLRDTAAVRGEVPQLVEQRVGGRALASIRLHHEGGKVIPVGPMQGRAYLSTFFWARTSAAEPAVAAARSTCVSAQQ